MRMIDADALKAKLRERLQNYEYRPDDFGIGRCAGMTEAMEIVDATLTIHAIQVEWMDWRIMNAKYNGIKEAADAFDFVLNCWKEQEAQNDKT